MKRKVRTYVTRIRNTSATFKSRAYTKEGALKQVWRDIRGGYTYGVDSFTDLKRKAIVKVID